MDKYLWRFPFNAGMDINAQLRAVAAAQTENVELYLRSAHAFLIAMANEPLSENADSYRREATEDIELALRALGAIDHPAIPLVEPNEKPLL